MLFYQQLHRYMKKWPLSSSSTKTAIGKFYIAIDKNLQDKGYRPDNAYRFIERTVGSKQPPSATMKYGLEDTEVKSLEKEVKQCSECTQKLSIDFKSMERNFNKMKKQLDHADLCLRDITNELKDVSKKRDVAQKKANRLQKSMEFAFSDCTSLEDNLYALEEKNSELSKALASTKQMDLPTFDFETKLGNKTYSPAIRTLYYTLLAEQVPPAKISDIIKNIVKCFFPAMDVQQLELPKERCAGYMRSEEMKTVSMAHKATVICEHANDGQLYLNTDGTTLAQKKLGSVAINNVTVSVNEVSDGTAAYMIDDVSRELQKLREMAHALNIPNADSINWTLIASATSDSAATQKCFNKLIEQSVEADKEKFGEVSHEAFDLVENFCAMHLGVNLRKAFLDGMKATYDHSYSDNREYHAVDTLVYEFCKLFGRHGTPEYGCGTLAFPDFLVIMSKDPNASNDYYSSCTQVTFDRQVGSRYFVTAANATKIIFVREAAIHFLKYTGKENGNRLEKEVYRKLLDSEEIMAQVKADALMFFHVYADLVMLAKSNKLQKSALSMNRHYLELQMFLQELEQHPEVIMERNYHVFRSEDKLYGDDKEVNHRIHCKSISVYDHLFTPDKSNEINLYSLVSAGAASMKKKLCVYAQNQLPGGIYWDPEPNVEAVLKELKPSNDLCESILGLNDYLSTAIPNLHQMARSNLIEIKKNKSMKWLQQLPSEQKDKVLDLAVKRRREVLRERKEEDQKRAEQRRDKLIQVHTQRQALLRRAQVEKDKLLEEHLITSEEELHQSISDIDKEQISISKKKKKITLLKTQVNIRKKLLKEKILITFSQSRKQRPINDLVKELAEHIAANSLPPEYSALISNPFLLVGKSISHKFELEETCEEKWYRGVILGYDLVTKLYEIAYDEEDESCHFDLTQDLIMGNLQIM